MSLEVNPVEITAPLTLGYQGWTPQLAVVADGERRVLQVIGWTDGGQGAPPATGLYVGVTGLVVDIADGIDIRGSTGATGATGPTGPQGPGVSRVSGRYFNAGELAVDEIGITREGFVVQSSDNGTDVYAHAPVTFNFALVAWDERIWTVLDQSPTYGVITEFFFPDWFRLMEISWKVHSFEGNEGIDISLYTCTDPDDPEGSQEESLGSLDIQNDESRIHEPPIAIPAGRFLSYIMDASNPSELEEYVDNGLMLQLKGYSPLKVS